MASQIKVKGRLELVVVSDDKARQIKRLWMDASVDRDMVIDLGRWAGTLGDIKDFRIEPEHNNQRADISDSYMSYGEFRIKTMPDKVRYGLNWFDFLWFGRTFGNPFQEDRPENHHAEAKAILEAWYTENPSDPICPPERFQELLPRPFLGSTAHSRKSNGISSEDLEATEAKLSNWRERKGLGV